MAPTDVKLENVSKRFGDVVAVDNISLEVEQGDFLTLLGPSGCGKTTTLRCIAGLHTPSEGEIYLGGRAVTEVPPFERDIGMVFQSYALFPHMTVGENISFGLQMQNQIDRRGVTDHVTRLIRRTKSEEIEAKVAEMLELVELPGLQDRNIEELSGGQQQRVALARALVTEPTVLLLDEPLGALDLQLRQAMQVELKNLQSQLGTTFVYVTHDQEEALTMSDRIAVMNDGRIEQVGTGNEIYENPRTEFVADFIGESNIIRGEYAPATKGGRIEVDGLSFTVPETTDASGEVAVAIRPQKIRIGSDAVGLENTFEGKVVDRIYQGNVAKYILKLNGDRELTVNEPIRGEMRSVPTGQSITVGWETDSAVVLPE